MSVQLANPTSSSNPIAHSSSWNPTHSPQLLAHSSSHRSNGDDSLQLPPMMASPFPNSVWNSTTTTSNSTSSPNQQASNSERRTSPHPPTSSYQHTSGPSIHSSPRPNDPSTSSSRLPSLSTSLFPSSRPPLSQVDLEEYRRELLSGRQWLQAMLEKTSLGLQQVDEEMMRGRAARAAAGEAMAVDQARTAVPLNRTASSSTERTRESIWGLDNRGQGQ